MRLPRIRHRHQRRDRSPIPRRGRHGKFLLDRRVRKFGSSVAVRAVQINLASAYQASFAGRGQRGQQGIRGFGRRRRQKSHVQFALIHAGFLEPRILIRNGLQFGGGPGHDHDRIPKVGENPSGNLAGQSRGGSSRGFEHDVPALHVGLHVVEAQRLERRAQALHFYRVMAADIDAADKGDEDGHIC